MAADEVEADSEEELVAMEEVAAAAVLTEDEEAVAAAAVVGVGGSFQYQILIKTFKEVYNPIVVHVQIVSKQNLIIWVLFADQSIEYCTINDTKINFLQIYKHDITENI